jgi:hypothetical protein
MSLSPEGGETKNIISSAPAGLLFIVLPLPPVSPRVIKVKILQILLAIEYFQHPIKIDKIKFLSKY